MKNKDNSNNFSIFSFKGCVLILFVLLLLIGIGAGITIAKTGLLHIPILSNAVYKPAQPTRKVVTQSSGVVIEEEIFKKFSAIEQGNTQITLTEEEATSILRSQISEMQSEDLDIKDAQIVFLDNAVELYAEVTSPQETVAKIVIEPYIKDGDISIKIRNIEIGGLNLPSFIPNLAISTLLEGKIAELEEALAQSPVRELQIIDGQLRVLLDSEAMKQLE